MLEHFHFTEMPLSRKTPPHGWISFEDALALPTIEDVDVLPGIEAHEMGEVAKLEAIGAEILTRIYHGEKEGPAQISCKNIHTDRYRV